MATGFSSKRALALADATSTPDYRILLDVIRERDPRYEPPTFTTDVETNVAGLKQMLVDAWEANPLTLARSLLGQQLSALAKDFGGAAQGAFMDEAVTWAALHLENRYAQRDADRGDGTRFSNAASSSCIRYWDPVKGGVVAQVQGYFHRTLKPAFLEHMCERKKRDGHHLFSLDAAKEFGLELTQTANGISLGASDYAGGSEYGAGPDPEESGHEYDDGAERTNGAARSEDEIAADDHAAVEAEPGDGVRGGAREQAPTNPLTLLTRWLDRNSPEYAEAMARGSRTERLNGVKRAVEVLLRRGVVPDAADLLEDFDAWDPRRTTLSEQFPEVVEFLEKDEVDEEVRKRVEAELNRESNGFLFPDEERTHLASKVRNKHVPAAQPELDLSEQHAAAGPADALMNPRDRLIRMNGDLAAYLGHELDASADPLDAAKYLMRDWADKVLHPSPTTPEVVADVIDEIRRGVKKGVEKWDFMHRSPMHLVKMAVSRTTDDRELDERTVEDVSATIQQNQSERRWLKPGSTTLVTGMQPAVTRDEY